MRNSSSRTGSLEFASDINPIDSGEEPEQTDVEETNPLGQDCELCTLTFDTYKQLLRHKLSRHKSEKRICARCKQVFFTEQKFAEHMEDHNISRKKTLRYRKMFRARDRKHTNSTSVSMKQPLTERKLRHEYKFRCNDCATVFLKRYDYEEHTKDNKCDAMSLTYICKLCLNELDSNEEMRKHKCLPCFICDFCDREFATKFKLTKHIKEGYHQLIQTTVTANPLGQNCELCTLSFDTPEQLVSHKLAIHKSEKRSCQLCKRLFFSAEKLAEHSKAHETSRKNTLKCSSCKRFFFTRKMLAAHERSHTNVTVPAKRPNPKIRYEYKFRCNDCEKIFTKRYEYEEHAKGRECDATSLTYICKLCLHELNSNEERRSHKCVSCFICNSCDCVFTTKLQLIKHIGAVHHSARAIPKKFLPAHQCMQCDLQFTNATGLKEHNASTTHSALSLFTCKVCWKMFTDKDKLDKHVEAHEVQVASFRHPCHYCPMKFKFLKQLLAHFASTHRDIKPYECTGCGEKFKLRSQFACHVRFYHKSMGRMKFCNNLVVFVPDDASKCIEPQVAPDVEKATPDPPKLILVSSKTSGLRITTRPIRLPSPKPFETVKLTADEKTTKVEYLKLNLNKNLEISRKSIIKRISSDEASLKRKMNFSGEPIARPQKAIKSDSFSKSSEKFVCKSNNDYSIDPESLYEKAPCDDNVFDSLDDASCGAAPRSFNIKNGDGQSLTLVNVDSFKQLTPEQLKLKNTNYKKKTYDCLSIIEKGLMVKDVRPNKDEYDSIAPTPSSSFCIETGDGKTLQLINVNPFPNLQIKKPKPKKSDYKPKTYDCLAIIEKGLKFGSVSQKKGTKKKKTKTRRKY